MLYNTDLVHFRFNFNRRDSFLRDDHHHFARRSSPSNWVLMMLAYILLCIIPTIMRDREKLFVASNYIISAHDVSCAGDMEISTTAAQRDVDKKKKKKLKRDDRIRVVGGVVTRDDVCVILPTRPRDVYNVIIYAFAQRRRRWCIKLYTNSVLCLRLRWLR